MKIKERAMSCSGTGKVVCVTGASGYIASCLVKLLLHHGYTVKATVRDPLAYNRTPLTADVLIDETWFSDPAFCEEQKLWYVLSKTLAEEAALQFAKENEIDLVTMNPGLVIGPLLQPTLNLSVEVITNLIKGVQIFSGSSCRYVDVRDVAYAHLLAFENPSATRRYLLAGRAAHHSEVLSILHQLFPTLISPKMREQFLPFEPTYQISKEKAEILGISYTPLEVSLQDIIESLKDKKMLIASELADPVFFLNK